MNEFKPGDRVVVGPGCHDTQYCGHVGVVLQVIQPNSDGQGNRVSLDSPVNHQCLFWFRDDELVKQ